MAEDKNPEQIEAERVELIGLVRGLHNQVSQYAKLHGEHKDHGGKKACDLIRQAMEKRCNKYLDFDGEQK